MIYLLIIFIVVLAMAPLLHFAPSKHQRRVARLREFAALQGLFVEFRPIPQATLSSAELSNHAPGRTIYYVLRIPAVGRVRPEKAAWLNGDQGWRSIPRGRPVPAPFENLPREIFAASVDEGSWGVYWQEDGDEAEIALIHSVLASLLEPTHS